MSERFALTVLFALAMRKGYSVAYAKSAALLVSSLSPSIGVDEAFVLVASSL